MADKYPTKRERREAKKNARHQKYHHSQNYDYGGHPELNIEGPLTPAAAPGAATMTTTTTASINTKRTSSNIDRESEIFREEDEDNLKGSI